MAVDVVELLSAVLQHSPSNRTGMLHINGVVVAGVCRCAVMAWSLQLQASQMLQAKWFQVLPWPRHVSSRARIASAMLPASVLLSCHDISMHADNP